MTLAVELVRTGTSPGSAAAMPNGTVAAVTAISSSTQTTAVELAAGVNRITGADGVRLPNVGAGESVICVNDTGSTVKVWPPTGGAIQIPGTSFGLAVANAAGNLTQFSTATYLCVVGGATSLWAVTKSA